MRYMDFEDPPPVNVTLAMTTLRVVTAVVVLAHAWLKLNDLHHWQSELRQLGAPFAEVVAPLSVAAGLFVGAGLLLGWLTRVSAFAALCAALFAIAILQAHGLYARDGGFEYPLLVAAVSLVFLNYGGGRMSADRLLLKRARRRAIEMDELWRRPPYVATASKG